MTGPCLPEPFKIFVFNLVTPVDRMSTPVDRRTVLADLGVWAASFGCRNRSSGCFLISLDTQMCYLDFKQRPLDVNYVVF